VREGSPYVNGPDANATPVKLPSTNPPNTQPTKEVKYKLADGTIGVFDSVTGKQIRIEKK
jgi:hypothetical protein